MAADTTVANRITVGLLKKTDDELTQLQEQTGLSKTDVVNRAITTYKFVQDVIDAGETLLVRRANGELERVHLI